MTFILIKGKFGHRDIAHQEGRQYALTGKMALSKSRRGTWSRLLSTLGAASPADHLIGPPEPQQNILILCCRILLLNS